MKRTKRECLEGNGLVRSDWFYCGVLMGEFGAEDEGSFFLLDHALWFFWYRPCSSVDGCFVWSGVAVV